MLDNSTNREQSACLCGAVTVSVAKINPKFSVCHCETCRTWGGSPLFAVQCGTDVAFDNKASIAVYDSSAWAERGFCRNCGTHLFYRLKATGEYNMPVGMFPQLKGLTMDMQYFSDTKPDYYCFSNETKTMTKDEIMAYFAAQ
jgi:hypothetical protein